MNKISIHYLYHSGFAVETANFFLVFDYYKDSFSNLDKTLSNGLISPQFLKDKKNVVVFASHSHSDHFNPVVLKWSKFLPDIKYVLSDDINIKNSKVNYHSVSPYQQLEFDGLTVNTYGSTDMGVSFLVGVDNSNIFHSGDLNWWHWKDDTAEVQRKAESDFKSEVEKIKGQNIDIAFFPVDSRLEENYFLGAKYFFDTINPKLIIPMHFGDDFNITKEFIKYVDTSNTVEITHRGQEIIIG